MRVAHLSSMVGGGAGGSARRVHEGVLREGVGSRLLTLDAGDEGVGVQTVGYGKGLRLRLSRRVLRSRIAGWEKRNCNAVQPCEKFTLARSPHIDLAREVDGADVVHLHWVAGLVDWPTFFQFLPRKTKLVWTLRDMNPITGGCHYDFGCGRFKERCGCCPQLSESSSADLSRQNWQWKARGLASVDSSRLLVVSLSSWLKDLAKASSLLGRFEHLVVPNGIDASIFKPSDKGAIRDVLGIPHDARVVAFIADQITRPSKGLRYLFEALPGLGDVDRLFLLAVGGKLPLADRLPPFRNVQGIRDQELLARIYAAADVFVMPSVQEAFGQTCLEALSCGIPVVAFATGGAADMIEHERNGLLVPVGDAAGLASAVRRLLLDEQMRKTLSHKARLTVLERYTLAHETSRYIAIYRRVLGLPKKEELDSEVAAH
jgi:glycosyltransferase involved in cell wall biosynthesis